MLFGSVRDKEVAETHNERMDWFKECVANIPGDNMEKI